MNRDTARHLGRHLPLYLTNDHPCSYLEGFQARTLFVDPSAHVDSATYQSLIDLGFRRSGPHIYRPACRGCSRCVPVRIPVEAFRADRSQRRNWTRNARSIRLLERPAAFDPSHFNLYQRYLATRHAAGQMAEDASEESYRRFLVERWGGTSRFIELRLADQLLGVAVTDLMAHGLSAVYTFFEPTLSDRAPGTFAILAQIEMARQRQLPYLYLGYWIGRSRKMAYKERFRPIEAWDGRRWSRFERGTPLDPS